MLAENSLQILCRGGDGGYIEVLHQEVEDVGGDKSRQAGSEFDVFDTEVQQGRQGRQDDYSLLFVLGQAAAQRQVINPALEGTGQSYGNLDGTVGDVALSNVEQPRNAADIAEKAELVKAVLAAGQG